MPPTPVNTPLESELPRSGGTAHGEGWCCRWPTHLIYVLIALRPTADALREMDLLVAKFAAMGQTFREQDEKEKDSRLMRMVERALLGVQGLQAKREARRRRWLGLPALESEEQVTVCVTLQRRQEREEMKEWEKERKEEMKRDRKRMTKKRNEIKRRREEQRKIAKRAGLL